MTQWNEHRDWQRGDINRCARRLSTVSLSGPSKLRATKDVIGAFARAGPPG